MNYNPTDFYGFLRDCYLADNQEMYVDNVLAQKFRFKWFVSTRERLLNHNQPIIPYFNKKNDELSKDLQIHRLEKALYYGYIFLLGERKGGFGKDKRLCAPLFLYPVTHELIDDTYYIRINRSGLIINRYVLQSITFKEGKSKDQFIEALEAVNAEDDLSTFRLKRVLEEFVLDIDGEELSIAPEVWQIDQIKDYFKAGNHKDTLKFIPAAGTVYVKKADSSLMISEDLKRLKNNGDYSIPLDKLGSDETVKPCDASAFEHLLNADQFQALKNSMQFANSLMIGPPGTGKSYTISCIAANALLNNESVLVVGKTDQAVNVIKDLLKNEFKITRQVTQTTSPYYKNVLKNKIRRLLTNVDLEPIGYVDVKQKELLGNRIYMAQKKFEDIVEKELKLTEIQFSENRSFYEGLQKWFWEIQHKRLLPAYKVMAECRDLEEKLEHFTRDYIKHKFSINQRKNLRDYRQELLQFNDALHSDNFSIYKKKIAELDFSKVLKNLPLWLVTLNKLNSVIPCVKNAFDLVIIDEATQCDLASAIPAIYRAKRVVVVGDPNQLGHYSFLSKFQQQQFREKHQLPDDSVLDYRNRSILDFYINFLTRQEQVSYLKEHYRSVPSLIDFSNQKYYNGNLKILKSTPTQKLQGSVALINTLNPEADDQLTAEIDSLIENLDQLIAEYKPMTRPPSIGIISPLSKQVSALQKAISDHLELETLKRHDLLVGTAYHFQGSERDIILYSLGLTDDSHHSAFRHVMEDAVFNVSMTRAKSRLMLFHSLSEETVKRHELLSEYFSFVNASQNPETTVLEHDTFQKEVATALEQLENTTVYASYPMAGMLLDLLVKNRDTYFFIDLIGYPGQHQAAFDQERYRVLSRTGVICIPLNWNHWKNNQEQVVNDLSKFFDKHW